MLNGVLEVCVDSYESAEAAVRGGATRLELCSNLVIGGTTPGMHLFQKIKTNLSIPVNVLIRPRFGDFCIPIQSSRSSEDVKPFTRWGRWCGGWLSGSRGRSGYGTDDDSAGDGRGWNYDPSPGL